MPDIVKKALEAFILMSKLFDNYDDFFREYKKHASTIDGAIDEIWKYIDTNSSTPADIMWIMDECKSFATKYSINMNRQAKGFISHPNIGRHNASTIRMINTGERIEFLKKNRGLVVCEFIVNSKHEIYATLSTSNNERVVSTSICIVKGESEANNFNQKLIEYIEGNSRCIFDQELHNEIMVEIGQNILPILSTIECSGVVLIPHKKLRHIPLHSMIARTKFGTSVSLSDLYSVVVYSHSFFDLIYREVYRSREGLTGKMASEPILFIEGSTNEELKFTEYERLGFRVLGLDDIETKYVDDLKDVPPYNDFVLTIFSGHSYVGTDKWGHSLLKVGNKKMTAIEIAHQYTFLSESTVVLTSCQSSIGQIHNNILNDEVMALDTAFKMAHASYVVSTFFPVPDDIAALLSVYMSVHTLTSALNPIQILHNFVKTLKEDDWLQKIALIPDDISSLSPEAKKLFARMGEILCVINIDDAKAYEYSSTFKIMV